MVEYSAFNRFVPGSIPGQPNGTPKYKIVKQSSSCEHVYLDRQNLRTRNLLYTPRGIRIPVTSVKGRCPRPLDDGGAGLT